MHSLIIRLFILLGLFFPALAPADTAVEFYNAGINHYFMTASIDEAAFLDSKPSWGWVRTGKTFNVWLTQSSAPSSASPVCRFYGVFANGTVGSHFYTVDPDECAYVKSRTDWGWGYEGDAFYAVAPTGGSCPSGTSPSPIYRAYNNGMGGAPNHRYMTSQADVNTMISQGWVLEGTAFCGASTTVLSFTVPLATPDGIVGRNYYYNFCNPAPASFSFTTQCPLPGQAPINPTGGNPPYHFQLDSGVGFPPMGISLGKDGQLYGTPTTPGTYTFGVCAIDLSGNQVCGTTRMTVKGALDGTMNWTIGDQCNNGAQINYKFYDQANGLVWPSSTSHYYITYSQTKSHQLSCVTGSSICIGAQSGSMSWGVGINGTSGCSNCCRTCDGSTYPYTFGCSSPSTFYYANWSCGSSSQCAYLMSGYAGSTGPFCSLSSCQAWGNYYIPSGYSCSTQPTYEPKPGGTQCF